MRHEVVYCAERNLKDLTGSMGESRIQQLYHVCKRTFLGARTPSVEALGEVRAVLGALTAPAGVTSLERIHFPNHPESP